MIYLRFDKTLYVRVLTVWSACERRGQGRPCASNKVEPQHGGRPFRSVCKRPECSSYSRSLAESIELHI